MSIYEYAITARKTRKPILEDHYNDYLSYMGDIGEVGNVAFETTRGLHIHFVLRTKGRVDYKYFKPTKYGWNIKAVPIYNKDGWVSYCMKDSNSVKPLTEQEQQSLRRKIIKMNCCNNNDVKLRA